MSFSKQIVLFSARARRHLRRGLLTSLLTLATLATLRADLARAPHPRVAVVTPETSGPGATLSQLIPSLPAGTFTLTLIAERPLENTETPQLRENEQPLGQQPTGLVHTALAEQVHQHRWTVELPQATSAVTLSLGLAPTTTRLFHISLTHEGQEQLQQPFFSTDEAWTITQGVVTYDTADWSLDILEATHGLEGQLQQATQALQTHLDSQDTRDQQLDTLQQTLTTRGEELGQKLTDLDGTLIASANTLQSLGQAITEHSEESEATTEALQALQTVLSGQTQEWETGSTQLESGQDIALRNMIERRLADRAAKPLAILYIPQEHGGLLETVFTVVSETILQHETSFPVAVNTGVARIYYALAVQSHEDGRHVSAYNQLARAYYDLVTRRVRSL